MSGWATNPVQRWDDFGLFVLGGAWTQTHVGVPADAIRGRARGEVVKAWVLDEGRPNVGQARDQGFR